MNRISRYALLGLTGLTLMFSGCAKQTPKFDRGEMLAEVKSYISFQEMNYPKGRTGFQEIDNLNHKYHVKSIEKVFEWSKDGELRKIIKFNVPESTNLEKMMGDYKKIGLFDFVEEDMIVRLDPEEGHAQKAHSNIDKPNDPLLEKQWGPLLTNAVNAWKQYNSQSNHGKKIIVAICDTGVDYNHVDLKDIIWKNDDSPGNGKDDDKNGFIDDTRGWDFEEITKKFESKDPMDRMGHGTHCAGIVAAMTNNGKGIMGTSWNTEIMPVKVLSDSGYGTDEDIAEGIVYAADNGADVISLSLGSAFPSQIIKKAVGYATSKGVVVVAAAGNSNSGRPSYPAGYDGVISVGAIDSKDKRASFSNYGETVDVCAPGVDILSSVPKDQFKGMAGTSMACPHVSGLAAMIKSANPSLSSKDIEDIIKKSSVEIKTDKEIGPRIDYQRAIEMAKQR